MNAKGNFPYDQLKNEDLLLKVLINNNFCHFNPPGIFSSTFNIIGPPTLKII